MAAMASAESGSEPDLSGWAALAAKQISSSQEEAEELSEAECYRICSEEESSDSVTVIPGSPQTSDVSLQHFNEGSPY